MDSHAIMIPVVIREARYTSAWSFNHIDGYHHSLSPWQQLDYAELGPVRQFWHRSQRSIPLLTLLRCDQQAAEALLFIHYGICHIVRTPYKALSGPTDISNYNHLPYPTRSEGEREQRLRHRKVSGSPRCEFQ